VQVFSRFHYQETALCEEQAALYRLQFINMTGLFKRIEVTIFDMPVELPTIEPYKHDVDSIDDIQDLNMKRLQENDTIYNYNSRRTI